MTVMSLGVKIESREFVFIVLLLSSLNSCVNPLVYARKYEDFQNAGKLIWKKFQRKAQTQSAEV